MIRFVYELQALIRAHGVTEMMATMDKAVRIEFKDGTAFEFYGLEDFEEQVLLQEIVPKP